MAFFQTDTVLLLLFLVFFSVFLFRRLKPWMTGLFGFAAMLTAISLKWNILILLLLGVFIFLVVFSYARKGGKGK